MFWGTPFSDDHDHISRLTKLALKENKLVVQEPRSEEENYEYTHSFVIIKTEEEGAAVKNLIGISPFSPANCAKNMGISPNIYIY